MPQAMLELNPQPWRNGRVRHRSSGDFWRSWAMSSQCSNVILTHINMYPERNRSYRRVSICGILNDMNRITTRPVPQVAPFAPDQALGEHAQLLKVLAEPMRLSILRIIASQNGAAVCACDFPDALGISQPTASHHLKRLTDAGLLIREQRGKWAWFSLAPDRLRTLQQFLTSLSI